MPSIFSRIIAGEIPSHKIAEDEKHYAFLDINPVKMGHTLVIPKKEVDYMYDLEPQALADLQIFAQKIAKAIRLSFDCNRVGTTVIGLEVPHAHIHLIPINTLHDMDFTKPKMSPSPEELTSAATKIRSNL